MYVHCKLKYSLFKLSNFTLKNMKFVSRYLIMNMNLNKNTIFSAGCTSRLSAQRTQSLLTTARQFTGLPMYRRGSVHVRWFHL